MGRVSGRGKGTPQPNSNLNKVACITVRELQLLFLRSSQETIVAAYPLQTSGIVAMARLR
jgi:hypothetical protein